MKSVAFVIMACCCMIIFFLGTVVGMNLLEFKILHSCTDVSWQRMRYRLNEKDDKEETLHRVVKDIFLAVGLLLLSILGTSYIAMYIV